MRPESLSPVSRSPAVHEVCEVVITAPDPDWLAELTHELVTDGLCASGHNFAPIRSIYRWQCEIYVQTGGRVALRTLRSLSASTIGRTTRAQPSGIPSSVAFP